MKKGLLIAISAIIVITLLIFKINDNTYLYVNPFTNTDVLPYISHTIKDMNKIVNRSMFPLKLKHPEMKVLYSKAYGSGFLKHNKTPNDFDYGIGIYLGKYEFDGKNSQDIATDINQKISDIYSNIYSNLNKTDKYFTNEDETSSLHTQKDFQYQTEILSEGLYRIFRDKPYLVQAENATILVKDDELVRTNTPLIKAYTDTIQYYKNERTQTLKKVSISANFYADIKYNDRTKFATIIPEVVSGTVVRNTRTDFVPEIYTSNSKNWLKYFIIRNDNHTYLTSLFTSFSDLMFSAIEETSYIKKLKRIEQSMYNIYPILSDEIKNDITEIIDTNINEDLVLLNDFETLFRNLVVVGSHPKYFFAMKPTGILNSQFYTTKNFLTEIENKKIFNKNDYNKINDICKAVVDDILQTDNINKLLWNTHNLTIYYTNFSNIIANHMKQDINPDKIAKFNRTFSEIFTKSGFHKVDLYLIDENNIGIKSDDFTKMIKDFDKFAQQNDLPNVNYKLVQQKDMLNKNSIQTLWARFNSTSQEEKYYNEIKQKLIEDRKNYNIKRKFAIPKFFL